MTAGVDGNAPQAAAPPAEKPNPFQRIIGVFTAPTETFQSVGRRPDVTVPLIIQLVISLAIGIVMASHVDFASAQREMMEEQGRSAAQIESATKVGNAIGKAISYASPVLGAIAFLILSGILHLSFRMFGGEQDYTRAFSATVYAWFINTLQSIIMAVVMLIRGGTVGAQELPTVVRTNLAFLVDVKTNPVLFSIASNFDVFTIWYAVVLIIAFAAISRLSRGKSAGIIIGLYVIKILFGAGFAGLGAMMASRAR